MKSFSLLFHTLRHLKWHQIYFRIYRKFTKPKITERFSGDLPRRNVNWKHITLYNEKITTEYIATFLNCSKQLTFPSDWNNESLGKLWTYNLHYFDDLLAINAADKQDFHLDLLSKWVNENPAGVGNGWESYTISLRLVNVLKAWQGGLDLDKRIIASLYSQASYLSNSLEKHLLGNHYFANLKALLFAGVILNNSNWVALAEKELLKEIPEQILDDGFNFELSPMYHSIMLLDMLDICNLSRCYHDKISGELSNLVKSYVPLMMNCLQMVAHPDGHVSHFNDSADGIAPSKEFLEEYGEALNFEISHINLNETAVHDLSKCGYMVAIHDGTKLIFDAANIGPDYIPGHAHADTLSFEMSIGLERVFTNTGTYQYNNNEQRLKERKTKSHNTVEVNESDSSQVWSSFRVAKRARITARSLKKRGNQFILSASHDGYKGILSGVFVNREMKLNSNSLIINDAIDGNFKLAVVRFYIAPDLNINLADDELTIIGKTFVMRSNLGTGIAKLTNSHWHPQFGISKPNKCLEITFTKNTQITEFTWRRK